MSETAFSGVVCILAHPKSIFSEGGSGVTAVLKTVKNLKIKIIGAICELLRYEMLI